MRAFVVRFWIVVLLSVPFSGVTLAQEETESLQVLDKLQAAAIQHEVVALSIEESKFQSVVPELKVIFDLDLPQEYEIYQVQEVQSVVQKLRDKRQFSVAHGAVDLALKYLQEDKSRAALYLLKSQLYRENGYFREAAEATELAKKFYQNSLRTRFQQ